MVNDAGGCTPNDVAVDVEFIVFDRGTVVLGADIPALHGRISQGGERASKTMATSMGSGRKR